MSAIGPLVPCEEAARHLDDAAWRFFDCRYDLADKEKGLREYSAAHIPGAVHAHIDRDLSGPMGDGRRGRHPLPLAGAFRHWAGDRGIGATTTVIAYDDGAGQWASRLWWLLRHHGHAKVAVLDGGIARWKALRLPLRPGHEKPRPRSTFVGEPGHMPTIDADAIAQELQTPAGLRLVDARAPERFRGEVEPVDKQAGHIPGAINLHFSGNVGSDMRFLPPDRLRQRFQGSLGTVDGGRVACYCGSGVTATQHVLAMELAGLAVPALYPGSWSEWSWPDAKRPIETGP